MKNIPKKCHLYWDGGIMSKYNVLTVISFHRLNPEWEIIVYTPKQDVKNIKNTYVKQYRENDYFEEVKKLSYVVFKEIDLNDFGMPLNIHACSTSDIFRTNILYLYGGVYSDFDVLWCRSIDYIKEIESIGDPFNFECTVCMYKHISGFHNVSVMISEKDSPYLKEIIEAQEKVKPPYEHQSYGSVLLNSIFCDYKSIIKKHKRNLFVKYETFFPYSIYEMERLYKTTDFSVLNKNVLAIHWFNGRDLSIEFLKSEDKCSMSELFYMEMK